ncbi:hypothetical protein HDU85_005946 [Gaertneriomyces sp. JEL0708]|nr:hypothetical protein HDU85_005946 [Gaertneriomyces sp. JEL0708]
MEDFFALCARTLAEREGKAPGANNFVGFPTFPTGACTHEESDADDSDLEDFFALRSAAHARDEQEEKSFESMMSQITALEEEAATACEIPEDMAALKAGAEERWDADEAAWTELVDEVMEVEWGAKREYESDSDDDDDWRVWDKLSEEFSHVDFVRQFPLKSAPFRCGNHECQRMHHPAKLLQKSRIGRLMRLRRAMQKTREFREKQEREEFAAIAAAAAAAGTIYGLDDAVTPVKRSLSAAIATQAPAAELTSDGLALTSPSTVSVGLLPRAASPVAPLDTCDAEFDDAALWTLSDEWATPRVGSIGHVSRTVSAATMIIFNAVSVETISPTPADGTASGNAAPLTLSDGPATSRVASTAHVSRTVSAATSTSFKAVSVETMSPPTTDGTAADGAALLTLSDDRVTPRVASAEYVSRTVSAATSTSINAVSVVLTTIASGLKPPTPLVALKDRLASVNQKVLEFEERIHNVISATMDEKVQSPEAPLVTSANLSPTVKDVMPTTNAIAPVGNTVNSAMNPPTTNAIAPMGNTVDSAVKPPTLKPPTPLASLKRRLASLDQKARELQVPIWATPMLQLPGANRTY